jgi:hypothetical protein
MNAIRHLRRLRPITKAPKRSFGAGQPESQSMQARLWEGHNTKPEGWETTIYATYAASTILIGLALGFAPDTTINTWAMNEAQARLNLKRSGELEKEEFGVFYNTKEKEEHDWETFMIRSMNPEEDDDDEEDEEDDDEDDEEDDDEEEEE